MREILSNVWRLSAAASLWIMVAGVVGCGEAEAPTDTPEAMAQEEGLDYFNTPKRTIAVWQGSAAMTQVEQKLPKAKIQYFTNSPIEALVARKVDAFAFDDFYLKHLVAQNPDLEIYPGEGRPPLVLAKDEMIVGLAKGRDDLRNQINAYIKQYRADGTYDEMYKRWFLSKTEPDMPQIPVPENPRGTLVVGTVAETEPASYIGKNKQLTGFDIEFAYRLGASLGYKVEFKIVSYGALAEPLASGKVDCIIATLNKTPERLQILDMTDSYLDADIVFIVPKPQQSANMLDAPQDVHKLEDLVGRKVAYVSGTTFPTLIEKIQKGIIFVPHNDNGLCAQALRIGRVDGVVIDKPAGYLWANHFPKELWVSSIYADADCGFAFRKGDPLCEKVNASIRELQRTGDLQRLIDKWLEIGDVYAPMEQWTHNPNYDGSAGTIRVGCEPAQAPLCYYSNDTYCGLDFEILNRAAYDLNMKLEVSSITFVALIESLTANKIDVIACSLSITEERKQSVDFSLPYYKSGIAVLARLPAAQRAEFLQTEKQSATPIKDFFTSLVSSFNRTFIRESRWKLILEGLEVTVIITVVATIIGTLLAFPLCMLQRAKRKFWRTVANSYIALMQGTPILVTLMILYYVVFAKFDINAILVAILGFAINFAAYASMMLHTGIQAVSQGQTEAALALGFPPYKAFLKVVFPQALRQMLPIYRGEFINLLKMTSVVGYIAIQDLTKMSDLIRSRTYEPFFPLIATAVIYFATAWFLTRLLSALERHLDPIERRAKAQQKADHSCSPRKGGAQ